MFGKYQKRRSPSANAEGLLLLHFQGIRPENPDQLPSFSGIPHRLPRPAGAAVPDGKYNVCMVYHILVPLSQTVRRVLPLQRRGCDIGRSTYAKYEAGELNIRASVLIKLREFYGCTYDDFFAGLD